MGRRWLLLFLFSFLAGILYVNFCESGEELLYLISRYRCEGIRTQQLFYIVIKKRLGELLFLILMAGLGKGRTGSMIFVIWEGMALGGLFSSFILAAGGRGIYMVMMSLLPQYLFYIPFFLYFMILCSHYVKRRIPEKRGDRIRRIFVLTGMLLILFAGIATEVFYNPMILKLVYT